MLRTRGLIALLSAEAISSLGAQMTFLALPWFVLVTTGSAAKMSLVLAVELLPVALLGIPSGMVISKWGARKTMVVGDAARAPLMLAIPLLHEAGWLSFPVLLACVWALGWAVTAAVGVRIEDGWTVFGSTGALVVTALTAVLPLALRRAASRGR